MLEVNKASEKYMHSYQLIYDVHGASAHLRGHKQLYHGVVIYHKSFAATLSHLEAWSLMMIW